MKNPTETAAKLGAELGEVFVPFAHGSNLVGKVSLGGDHAASDLADGCSAIHSYVLVNYLLSLTMLAHMTLEILLVDTN